LKAPNQDIRMISENHVILYGCWNVEIWLLF